MTDRAGVLAAAGSRYTYSANPLALLQAAELGLSKVALVGMGCQTSVTGAMEARRVNKWRRKIAWTFGLLCSKSFTYDGLMVEIAQKELGLDLDHLARVNIKGKLLFYTDTGDEIVYPLKQSHRFTRPGCLHCPDFAAEHADISFGGLGQGDGWTLSIVRTRARSADLGRRARRRRDRVPIRRRGPRRGCADVQARGPFPRSVARPRGAPDRRRHPRGSPAPDESVPTRRDGPATTPRLRDSTPASLGR